MRVFGASGEGATLIRFFCIYIAPTWLFVGATFVANAAFNNLGFPTWSSVFNWGRATVGTVPFVWLGATQFGPEGVIAGQAAGAVVFGLASIIVALRIVDRLAAHRMQRAARHDASKSRRRSRRSPPTRPRPRSTGPTRKKRSNEKRPPGGPAGAKSETSEGTRRSGSGWPTGENRPGQAA